MADLPQHMFSDPPEEFLENLAQDAFPETLGNPEESILQCEEILRLRQAIENLFRSIDSICRKIFILRFFGKKSNDEIRQILFQEPGVGNWQDADMEIVFKRMLQHLRKAIESLKFAEEPDLPPLLPSERVLIEALHQKRRKRGIKRKPVLRNPSQLQTEVLGLPWNEEAEALFQQIISRFEVRDENVKRSLIPQMEAVFRDRKKNQVFSIDRKTLELLGLIYINHSSYCVKGYIQKIRTPARWRILGLLLEAMLKLPGQKLNVETLASITGYSVSNVAQEIRNLKPGIKMKRGRKCVRKADLPKFLELRGGSKEGWQLVFKKIKRRLIY